MIIVLYLMDHALKKKFSPNFIGLILLLDSDLERYSYYIEDFKND